MSFKNLLFCIYINETKIDFNRYSCCSIIRNRNYEINKKYKNIINYLKLIKYKYLTEIMEIKFKIKIYF